MTAVTLRIPARWATIRPGSMLDVEVLIDRLTLPTLADALYRMEHNDTDPAERCMGADALRDALIRELVGHWSADELAQVLPVVATLTRERDEARARLDRSRFESVTVNISGPMPTSFSVTTEGATP